MEFLHRTWAEINLSALKHNFNVIKEKSGNSKIMAVVKANAYGHGVNFVVPALQAAGADSFAVSNITEALELRDLGLKKPILILGYTPCSLANVLSENNISQCVYSTEYAKSLSAFAQKDKVSVKIHIKLDTGMSRLGFNCRDESLRGIDEAIKAAKMDGFIFEGVFTHFAVADRSKDSEDGFTNEQYSRFEKAVDTFKECGLDPKFVHCCNSAAFLKDGDKHKTYCRPGIILYGLSPDKDFDCFEGLIPVMTLKSVVSMVKTINKGDTVSYGRTFKAEKDMKIATVTAGYADGYPRALSGKANVLIGGRKAPIIGRICMDQMLVDVSEIDAKMGDEVILFGKDLSVTDLGLLANTINYEIICNISPRVPRIIKE